jgi:hypothetical protein
MINLMYVRRNKNYCVMVRPDIYFVMEGEC